jgi:hypothetical protein
MMAIKSSPFGPVILTGEDAKAFDRQIAEGKPNPLAKLALERGDALVREFKKRHWKEMP